MTNKLALGFVLDGDISLFRNWSVHKKCWRWFLLGWVYLWCGFVYFILQCCGFGLLMFDLREDSVILAGSFALMSSLLT